MAVMPRLDFSARTRRRARRRARLAAMGAAVLMLFACAFAAWVGSFEPVNLAWQTQLFQYRHLTGLDPKRAPIVIVGWDTNSAGYFNPQTGWDRKTTAKLITMLHRSGARLIL